MKQQTTVARHLRTAHGFVRPAVLFMILAFPLTLVTMTAVANDAAVQRWLGGHVCPDGWSFHTGNPFNRAPVRSRLEVPYCASPGDATRTLSISGVAAGLSPFLLGVGWLLLELLLTRPTAAEHLRQLELGRSMGALSDAQYQALRAAVLQDPRMTRARFDAIMQRERTASSRHDAAGRS